VKNVLDWTNVDESPLAQRGRVGRLTEHCRVVRQELDRRGVQVICVQMGHQHRVEPCDEILHRLGELDERIAPVVRRIGHRRPHPRRIELRVNQHPPSTDLDSKGCMADKTNAHEPVSVGLNRESTPDHGRRLLNAASSVDTLSRS